MRRTVLVTVALLAASAPTARAAIVLTPGANTVSTSRLALNLGDNGGNVERLDSLSWAGGANLVSAGGTPSAACGSGEALEAWGQAYGDGNVNPILVAAGSKGSLVVRGGRTAELTSSIPTACTGDSVSTAVRTRYAFFDAGAAANKIRVERRYAFSATTPAYANTQGLRAYVPRLPYEYTEVVHPNAAGNALVTDGVCDAGCIDANWNGTWLAINHPTTDAGMVILRDPANTSPAKLIRDWDSFSAANNSSVTLTRPAAGWTAPLTETEYLCFYDATSWPPANRAPNVLPPGCTAAAVPVNTAPPSIAGTAKVGSQLTSTTGTWESQTGGFAYQWSRCSGATCTAIPGATAATYTPVAGDIGAQLLVVVKATAPGGETDTATSAKTASVQPNPPVNTGAPTISGSAAIGSTLNAGVGSWTGSPTSFAFSWLRCDGGGGACAVIGGATGSSYGVTSADGGSRLRVRVVAANSSGPSAPADSEATGVVEVPAPVTEFSLAPAVEIPANTRAPAITGGSRPPRVSETLRADPGTWTGAPTGFRYQWRQCRASCNDLPGETNPTLALPARLADARIRVVVIALLGGAETPAVESAPTSAVVPRPGACANLFTGSPRQDLLSGTSGGDRIDGLRGNDRLYGLAGDDCLNGGDQGDRLMGGSGDDRLAGGNGGDVVDGDSGDDNLTGGDAQDRLLGGSGEDELSGGEAGDYLYGDEDDDTLDGDVGNDRLAGGSGDDTLDGGKGTDRLSGGSGDDTLRSKDNRREQLDCGSGDHDKAFADARDIVRHCETVVR